MIYQIVKALALPPASLFLLAFAGHIALRRWRHGRLLVTIALSVLYLLSIPVISTALMARLETCPPLAALGPLSADAQAIVILSAEARLEPEYPALSPGPLTLERLRYGAALQRRTGLPILVSGGTQQNRPDSLAGAMRRSLEEDFHVPVTWVEDRSQDTHQNAMRSADILKSQGITRILLVTHAWHMPRAVQSFTAAGLTVTPAPTAFSHERLPPDNTVFGVIYNILPSTRALSESYYALHELGGLAFYRVAYGISGRQTPAP
ncbi:MAG: YdcF family protein [Telmatospirillum sp.]|nr:YdcF family protein [Telmatospirillum sp.]